MDTQNTQQAKKKLTLRGVIHVLHIHDSGLVIVVIIGIVEAIILIE
jgi:hypothetical protein